MQRASGDELNDPALFRVLWALPASKHVCRGENENKLIYIRQPSLAPHSTPTSLKDGTKRRKRTRKDASNSDCRRLARVAVFFLHDGALGAPVFSTVRFCFTAPPARSDAGSRSHLGPGSAAGISRAANSRNRSLLSWDWRFCRQGLHALEMPVAAASSPSSPMVAAA